MKQAIMTKPGVIEFRDIEKPTITENQVLIQTKRIGVCGSDIHVFHGLHPYTSYPIVQGHEVGATIAEVGANVTKFSVGDVIVFMPQVTCGECYPCKNGLYHICESLKVMGFQTNGAGQEYFAIDANMVLKMPGNASLDDAALVEPISVAVHALRRGGDVTGKKVLVLGAGTIGNLVAQAAKSMGASQVMITDISDYKLAKARECNIDYAINSRLASIEQLVLQNFGTGRADIILECVGVQETITQAVNVARKGTTIVIVGVFGEKPLVDIGLVQDRELSLVGTLMYQKTDYEKAIELIAGGKMNLDSLVTHRFTFDHYLEAYHAIEESQGDYMKVMIDLD